MIDTDQLLNATLVSAILSFPFIIYFIVKQIKLSNYNRKCRQEHIANIVNYFFDLILTKDKKTVDGNNPNTIKFFWWDYKQAYHDKEILNYSVEDYINIYLSLFTQKEPIHIYRSKRKRNKMAERMIGREIIWEVKTEDPVEEDLVVNEGN